jgi:hypothetical protein
MSAESDPPRARQVLATTCGATFKLLSRRREMYPWRIAPYRRPVNSPRSVRATSSSRRGSGRIDGEG